MFIFSLITRTSEIYANHLPELPVKFIWSPAHYCVSVLQVPVPQCRIALGVKLFVPISCSISTFVHNNVTVLSRDYQYITEDHAIWHRSNIDSKTLAFIFKSIKNNFKWHSTCTNLSTTFYKIYLICKKCISIVHLKWTNLYVII
jgi:hypothetical protein